MPKLHSLTEPFQFRLINADNGQWSEIIESFAGANIYQTWAYEAARHGKNAKACAVLLEGDSIVAAAQIRLISPVPSLFGIAYIFWGPLWQPRGRKDIRVLRQMVRGLRNEFVIRRGLGLRILPRVFEDSFGEQYRRVLADEGFNRNPVPPLKRTLVLDVTATLDELRRGLEKQWRKHLNKAERSGLTVLEGTSDDLFARFVPLYRDLLLRKKFPLPNDIGQFIRMQAMLPDRHKVRIILAQKDGVDCAGAIGAALGQTGITLFRAANDTGMELNAPYLVHWRLLEWIKSRGCSWYDLMGINAETNPGTYHYKRGLCGKNGSEAEYIGVFDCFPTAFHQKVTRVAERIVTRAKAVRAQWKPSAYRAGLGVASGIDATQRMVQDWHIAGI